SIPEEGGQSGSRQEGDLAALPASESAGQSGDYQVVGAWVGFGVVRFADQGDMPGEFDHRVLESSAGAEERKVLFTGVAHGLERAVHAPVGTGRHEPEAREPSEVAHLVRRQPDPIDGGVLPASELQRFGNRRMRDMPRIEVSDQGYGFHGLRAPEDGGIRLAEALLAEAAQAGPAGRGEFDLAGDLEDDQRLRIACEDFGQLDEQA